MVTLHLVLNTHHHISIYLSVCHYHSVPPGLSTAPRLRASCWRKVGMILNTGATLKHQQAVSVRARRMAVDAAKGK